MVKFILVEGHDAAGKDSFIHKIKQILIQNNYIPISIHFPTMGVGCSEFLYFYLREKDKEYSEFSDIAAGFAFLSNIVQTLYPVMKHRRFCIHRPPPEEIRIDEVSLEQILADYDLYKNIIIIFNRSVFSTFAYQFRNLRNIFPSQIENLEDLLSRVMPPGHANFLIYAADDKELKERLTKSRYGNRDSLETIDIQSEIRQYYLENFRKFIERVVNNIPKSIYMKHAVAIRKLIRRYESMYLETIHLPTCIDYRIIGYERNKPYFEVFIGNNSDKGSITITEDEIYDLAKKIFPFLEQNSSPYIKYVSTDGRIVSTDEIKRYLKEAKII